MKRYFSILLLFSMMLQICGRIGVVVWFTINQQELTELFCVNKSTPSKHCDGKCYLSKRLKETESSETTQSKLPLKQKVSTEEVWFCDDYSQNTVYFVSTNNATGYAVNVYAYQYITSVFQPPQV